jgi:cytochrome c-type biogenesis protein CcmF
LNNLLLVVILLVVLIGTLYPLVADALHLGKISVGPPYFNFFFVPLMALLLLALPFGMMLKWKRDNIHPLKKKLAMTAIASVSGAVIFSLGYGRHFEWQGLLAVAVSLWTFILILLDVLRHCRHAPSLWSGMRKLPLSYKGMMIAHLGLVLATTGMALTSIYSESNDVRMDPGKKVSLASLSFVLNQVTEQEGPNYTTDIGDISVFRGESEIAHLHPEKRSYHSDRANRMTEAAIDIGWVADIYVSMGEPLDKENLQGAWAMRLHYKPFVRWIWLGAIVMALGGLTSSRDRRNRR